jgi:hypothetical protein
MNRTAKTFGRTAERLSRNPLGIIALFIVLVYLIAGTILGASSLGVSSVKLNPNERLPLVWFIVVYPVLVLIAFYRLVAFHHTKLYSPSDFPDDDGFFRALTPGEQKERLEREIQEIETIEKGGDPAAASDVAGSSVIPNNFRASWMLALELAIREVENEHQTPIQRQVAYAGQHQVDGVFLKGGVVNIVEVKLSGPSWISAARLAVEYIDNIAKTTQPAPRFTLAIVVRDLRRDRLERDMDRLRELLGSKQYRTDIRVYDFDQLKMKYGIVMESPDAPGPKSA